MNLHEAIAQLPTDSSTWTEQGGILGLIILFLLVGFYMLIRWLVGHLDQLAKHHKEEREDFLKRYNALEQDHRNEREEWRKTTAEAYEALRQSVENQGRDIAKQLQKDLDRMAESRGSKDE